MAAARRLKSKIKDASKDPQTKQAVKKFTELTDSFTHEALEIVHKLFPQKVAELSEFLASVPTTLEGKAQSSTGEGPEEPAEAKLGSKRKPHDSEDEPTRKRRRTSVNRAVEVTTASPLDYLDKCLKEKSKQEVPKHIRDVIRDMMVTPKQNLALSERLKAEIRVMVKVIGKVKIFIQLRIPKIEDGNNFGVGVQEETVNELCRAEDSGFCLLEGLTKYALSRGKLLTKILKHPLIEDFHKSVHELDAKHYTHVYLNFVDLRNNYAILHDMIIKNLEKLTVPRTENQHMHMF